VLAKRLVPIYVTEDNKILTHFHRKGASGAVNVKCDTTAYLPHGSRSCDFTGTFLNLDRVGNGAAL
jgi:hypothetical protein